MKALALWIPASGQLISNSIQTPEKVSETELDEFADTYEFGKTDVVWVDIDIDNRTASFETYIFGKPKTITMHLDKVTFIQQKAQGDAL
jgi:hypothetical protein